MRLLLRALVLAALLPATPAGRAAGPEAAALKYRSVGPGAGGRVSRACGVAGDPLTYYAATASGGVWKSANGGTLWKPIFDDQPTASVGAIAVAPSDANVVYVGSGEANIRGNVSPGAGIFKSEDGGKSWKHVWKQVGQIGTVVVHPKDAKVAFAAVLGKAFGPNPERGVYRTLDGGATWAKVKGVNDDTGAADVAIDVNNPRVVFAGFWQARRRPWELTSGGPGSDLFVSRDGGDTWKSLKRAKNGLPEGPWGRVGVAVAPSNGDRVYAVVEADKGGLFRSDDGGGSWALVNDTRPLRQRAWYYSTLTVHPTNPDVVYAPQVSLLKSIDGGRTFKTVPGTHHGDHHDVWIDPTHPARVIESNDGGVDISVDGGQTWVAPPLPISQFYHVHADNREPFHVMGCMQDLGSASGPSRSLTGTIGLGDFTRVGGGEAGHCVSDPTDPNIVYAGEYGGALTRFDRRTGVARNISVNQVNPSGIDPAAQKFRFQWTAPVVVSAHDPKTVYHAGNIVFRTRDAGQTWEAISPDLTRDDKRKQQWSGGPITGDNTGAETYCTVFALAESPRQKGLLWAGTDDGRVHVSTDDGKAWREVTANLPGLPDWGTVECIEPSPHDVNTAFVVVDNHRMDDPKPYVWRTTDLGKTWTLVNNGLDVGMNANAVREDPRRPGLLYLATERGLFASFNRGDSWAPLQGNLPTVPVADLEVKNDSLVVGTHGRSIWILDDLTPVRAWARAAEKAARPQSGERPASKPVEPAVQLFDIPAATKWAGGSGGAVSSHDRPHRAANPAAGASLWYRVAPDAPGTARELTLEIRNARGELVATAKGERGEKGDKPNAGAKDEEDKDDGDEDKDDEEPPKGKVERKLPAKPGLNRFVWDMTHDGAEPIPGAPVDSGSPTVGIPVTPGRFTAKLTCGGVVSEQAFEVRPDPRLGPVGPTPTVVRFWGVSVTPTVPVVPAPEQEKLALATRDQITALTRTVLQLRALQKQLELRKELLRDVPTAKGLLKESAAFGKKLTAVEEKLHNPKAKIVYDIFSARGGAMLYSQLTFLLGNVIEADAVPTKAMRELSAELAKTLDAGLAEFAALSGAELKALNAEARKVGVPELFVPPPAGAKP